jgi:hypothetical protein
MVRMTSLRESAVWLLLLTLALPGFASLRGLCCESRVAKSADCCASAMKMVGTGSPEMVSMTGAAIMNHRPVATAGAECEMAPVREVPALVVRSESSLEPDLSPSQDLPSALAIRMHSELSVAVSPLLIRVRKTPPESFLFDPLSISFRV